MMLRILLTFHQEDLCPSTIERPGLAKNNLYMCFSFCQQFCLLTYCFRSSIFWGSKRDLFAVINIFTFIIDVHKCVKKWRFPSLNLAFNLVPMSWENPSRSDANFISILYRSFLMKQKVLLCVCCWCQWGFELHVTVHAHGATQDGHVLGVPSLSYIPVQRLAW